MEATKLPFLLTEFHNHRLGAEIDDEQYHDAEVSFFDDLVTGVDARRTEIDAQIVSKLAAGWTIERLDKPMRQILRCGAYELIARPDVRTGTLISESVDVAKAFYEKRQAGLVNDFLDSNAKSDRASGPHPGIP